MRKPSASASGRREHDGEPSSTPGRKNPRARRALRSLAFFAILLAVLAIAATTQAATGVIGYFELGGEFEGSLESYASARAGDVGINANGAGGASPGDIYVFGSSVRQLSASNEFIRMWGDNTVKNGPDQANETQGIAVDATGGSFKLGFNGNTTADIPAAAAAGQVESALNGLASVGAGGVSVSGGPGNAGGTTPYIVTFGGPALAGKDQPQLKASDGSSPLSGGGASLTGYTTQNGGSGFEICEPASGDECRETGNGSNGSVAVDEANGDVFLTENNSIERYTADGHFLRSWGRDVVEAGPDDSSNNEVKSVTVKATGGAFTLAYRTSPGSFGETSETTAPLPYNATPAEVETALDNLEKIGGNYSSVTVTGGPGDLTGSNPYLVTFHGLLGGDDLLGTFDGGLLGANPNGLTISSGAKSAEVATVTNGGGEEICRARDACKVGASETPETPEALELSTFTSSLAVAPAGTPNAGDVVFGDAPRNRVQEYTPEGAFVRTFGWDVDATEPGSGFEVCTAESGHVCQEGSSGAGIGQFASPNGGSLDGVAEDSSGAIYTVEDTGSGEYTGFGDRVQKFTPSFGLDLSPSFFGTNETQALTVNAGAGQFRLALDYKQGATEGTGVINPADPTTVTNVTTAAGEFAVGQPLSSDGGDFQNAQIAAVGSHTLTLFKPLQLGYSDIRTAHLRSNLVYKTTDLPYNASAGEVEAALDALPSVGGAGGSVSVTGGPGSPGGSFQYLITFDGGTLARTDPMVIDAEDGAVPLGGGSGAGANTASVATTTPGGPGGARREGDPANAVPYDIAVGPGGNVFVAKLFPQVYTKCPDGEFSPFESRIEELDSSGTVLGTSRPCDGIKGQVSSDGRRTSLAVNELTGHPYLLNQNANADATRVNIYGPIGPDPSLALDPISGITANGGTISGTINPNGPGTSYTDTTGDLSSVKTTYRVEFKKASDSTWTKYTPNIPLSAGTSPAPFSVGVSGLEPKTEYELKVVAVKPFTATVEEAKSFATLPAPPEIEGFNSSDLTASAADLHALINPLGSETSFHFEYGTTPEYGQSTPETNIGEGHLGQAVVDHIEGLKDAVYHFRVVATNSSGTTKSEDQTFNFHPPICPNQTVRQQTGTAYLPDCRAYELVSPENAGGTTLFTGGPQSPYATNPPRLAFVGQYATIPNSGRNPIDTTGDLYVSTRGAEGWHTRYIGPSSEEAGCAGGRPLTSGTGGPNTMQNDVMADPGLNRIIDWNLGNPLECFSGAGNPRFFDFNTAARGSNAPYVWDANGDFLARWPTAAADVPGSEANFSCPQDPKIYPYPPGVNGNIPVSYFCHTFVDASKDLHHFVFSSQAGIYGEGGLTAAPGSAYDNDTAHNTLRLISKQPNGDPIEQEPGAKAGPEELIRFPAVSTDGSHVLMGTATKPECKQFDLAEDLCPLVTQPTHLYIRVNDAVSYDVSGVPVHYVGATPDVTKVYFTSDEQLTSDDNDTSTDLYMWSENGGNPQLTRISKGNTGSAGNTDDCASPWITACDIKTYDDTAITATPGNQGGLGLLGMKRSDPGYTDNSIAANSGDIYFYSPEQLVAGEGAPGKENLYVYREGSVRHVATLDDDLYCLQPNALEDFCSNGALGRLQVTPDGRFAAFITTTRLTAYDNHGFAEMYRYDADAEAVKCVSCRLDGKAPTVNVLGSEGGRFITDDGRVFFDTFDPLDPRDTNGGVFEAESNEPLGDDVYEFVDGRPQLITSGLGSVRRVGGSLAGLYGVSANGSDVYFGTFETLVGQDHNGQQLKFYDARTNGGFPFVPPPAPCAAADECHGPTAPVPVPLSSGTSAALGAGGNAQRSKPHGHKRRKGSKAKHRKSKKAGQHRAHNKAGGAR